MLPVAELRGIFGNGGYSRSKMGVENLRMMELRYFYRLVIV